MDNNYSLADIAAATGNEGFGGNSSWVLIILFAMIFGGGGFFGRGDGYGQFATAASQQEILFGQQFQGLDNKIDRIGNGIADATYALNNAITAEGRGLQTQLADVKYSMATGMCELKTAIHAEGEATRGLIQQNKIEELQQKIQALEMNQAMCGVVRYPMQLTYNAGGSPFCNNGCGCGNM